jgi:hypothetical protein
MGFALDIPLGSLRIGFPAQKWVSARRCCSGSLPSSICEAGINGLRPRIRGVPSIYSVSPLRVLDCRLPVQREVTMICVGKILRIL